MSAAVVRLLLIIFATTILMAAAIVAPAQTNEFRRPTNDKETKRWLENMVVYHQFTVAEIQAATGMNPTEIAAAIARFQISADRRPKRKRGDPLLVLPYPGGRHPRTGFLDGAVNPQRDTKFSVFAPGADDDYVVVDLPEAIWSNLGLTYLAHTHVPTIWTAQGVTLPKQEWQLNANGSLENERALPNGIAFGAKVKPGRDGVRMELWLRNGTSETLTGLRVQICDMLKGMPGFNQQSNENKLFQSPFVACRSADGKRWIITAWEHCVHAWGNDQVPCLHSDPQFPDCPPGATERLHGWLSFYEGADIQAELHRLTATALTAK